MYAQNRRLYHGTPLGAPRPRLSHPPAQRRANPYNQARGTSHFRDMPNPYAFPSSLPSIQEARPIPVMVTAPRPVQPSWQLQPRYEPRDEFVSAQEVLEGRFPDYVPRNLGRESSFQFGNPTFDEPELPDLDFGQWQRDADMSLLTLGHDSYDFGSVAGNSFRPTEEEALVLGTSSSHEKKVLKAHEQFIRMLRSNKATEALAMYDATYDFQFYRIFQGDKTQSKRNAMNNIFAHWSELFFHRLDGKPYQPSGFMVSLHSLFGELARRGVKYSLAKDFNYRGGFMRNLEARWNSHKLEDDTFAGRPTKVKMPEHYARDIRNAVKEGLLDPEEDVEDCQLLFAMACGTMLGFRGNQVSGGLLIPFFLAIAFICESFSLVMSSGLSHVGALRASVYRFRARNLRG